MSGTSRCRWCGGGRTSLVGEVGGYEFLRCTQCDFHFAPDITREDMEAMYRAGRGLDDPSVPDGGWHAGLTFLDPAFALLPHDRPLRVLDFGTGRSCLPEELRDHGHDVVAMDIAPVGDGVQSNMDAVAEGDFDLIIAFQVFEHLPEPRDVIERLIAVLAPQGILVVHTDMEPPARTDPFTGWDYVQPPDHCSFYRHRSFEVVAEYLDVDIVWRDPWQVAVRRRT